MATHDLFTAQTANADGTSYPWSGGVGTFAAYGTWDTATMTFQFSPDGGTTWIAVGDDTTLTADGAANFEVPRGTAVRSVLSSVGGSTSLSCNVSGG